MRCRRSSIRSTGRVHTTFNQAVAATGRLSSSDPNLQNIPIRTPLGREIRAAFVAEPGYVLISADYSQIELRVLAHLSGDAALVEAFTTGHRHPRPDGRARVRHDSGLDAHELRRRAKIINYALLYGKTAFTLAKDIGVLAAGGAGIHRRLLRRLPRACARSSTRRSPTRASTGVVRTLTGRRRLVPELTSKNGMMRVRGRARNRQHADPGHRRRRPQEGDDRRARARSPTPTPAGQPRRA